MNNSFDIKTDLELVLDDGLTIDDIASLSGVSARTIKYILSTSDKTVTDGTLNKLYSCIYRLGYKLNYAKEEVFKAVHKHALFHGSNFGLDSVTSNGSRPNCDFGSGFYLGESYLSAAEFVFESSCPSVYAFDFDETDLNIAKLSCSLEWMILICYYRGTIDSYKDSKIVKNAVKLIDNADIIIAPIADNKMFYVMQQFASGDITSDQAIYSLSASSLGMQYVFKTEKAIASLKGIERLYLSDGEKGDIRFMSRKHGEKIDTKLKLAKREYRGKGPYIDELFK